MVFRKTGVEKSRAGAKASQQLLQGFFGLSDKIEIPKDDFFIHESWSPKQASIFYRTPRRRFSG
jgi:hypothetical protein